MFALYTIIYISIHLYALLPNKKRITADLISYEVVKLLRLIFDLRDLIQL